MVNARTYSSRKLEKFEKPERECHVSMVTRRGNSAPGLAGSISSRLSTLAPTSTCSTFFQAVVEPVNCLTRLGKTIIGPGVKLRVRL